MPNRESKIEKYLHDEVERLGGTSRKWVSPGRAGVPDRIVFYKSKVFFVEIKTVDGAVSQVQVREIDRLRSFGADVSVVYGHEGVDNFINTIRCT